MHETGRSKLVPWDDPLGSNGEGGGRGFRMGDTCTPTWLIHVNVWQNYHNIVINLQLKYFFLKARKPIGKYCNNLVKKW